MDVRRSLIGWLGRKARADQKLDEERLLRAWPSLRGTFSGRCFIVGNGPSLREHDLSALKNDIVFAVNRGYLARSAGLPKPTFHVISDLRTYRANTAEIRAADVGLRFYRSKVARSREYQGTNDREFAIPFEFDKRRLMHQGHFSDDVFQGTARGKTVVLDAVQIATHLGFREIYVIGVDLSAPRTGPTHFYGSGEHEQARLGDMNVDEVIKGFAVAREYLEALGGSLRNAGLGGNLTTLERVSFSSLFEV